MWAREVVGFRSVPLLHLYLPLSLSYVSVMTVRCWDYELWCVCLCVCQLLLNISNIIYLTCTNMIPSGYGCVEALTVGNMTFSNIAQQ